MMEIEILTFEMSEMEKKIWRSRRPPPCTFFTEQNRFSKKSQNRGFLRSTYLVFTFRHCLVFRMVFSTFVGEVVHCAYFTLMSEEQIKRACIGTNKKGRYEETMIQ